MDGMGSMDGMGMDMGSQGMFAPTNMSIARTYWYLIAVVIAVLTTRRLIEVVRSRVRRKSAAGQHQGTSNSLLAFLNQSYDTTTAICRELAYPQLYWLRGSVGKYFNTPALGRILLLLTYWGLILTMLWMNVILSPASSMYAYHWEIVGFRAAWISVMQVPLIYCLSAKYNPITLLTGISYERFNWLHRWVSRTLFLTVIVHWSFFFREWWIADFVDLELQMMPMVKYGFAAWGTLGWMVLTGFGFFRNLAYEVWVLQHILAAYVLIWVLWQHVPAYARYNLWLSIAFVAFDRGARIFLSLRRNMHLTSPAPIFHSLHLSHYKLGFNSSVEALPNNYVHLTIYDVDFTWKPGQHVFICIPRFGIVESHPFTIATPASNSSDQLQLYIRVHSGLTKKLHRYAVKQQESLPQQSSSSSTRKTLRTFISGPWGTSPTTQIDQSESLILFATSTGASFIIPHLQYAVASASGILQRIALYWIVRHESQLDWFRDEILEVLNGARRKGVEVHIQLFVTGTSAATGHTLSKTYSTSTSASGPSTAPSLQENEKLSPAEDTFDKSKVATTTTTTLRTTSLSSSEAGSRTHNPHPDREPCSDPTSGPRSSLLLNALSTPITSLPMMHTPSRAITLDPLIRPVVEDTAGQTAILACGAPGLLAQIRNYVAALSDERGVHKGTGAQGLWVWTENYGW